MINFKSSKNQKGYTLIELMVAVSLIGVVIGMLYMYNAKGWNLFNKSLSFGSLQTDARAALEQLAFNVKRSSKDLIYVGTVYNSNVPLPQDAYFGKPYLYLAVPHTQEYKARELKSKLDTIKIPDYDYYLYYVGRAKDRDGNYASDRARLKQIVIKDQDGNYTSKNASRWPVMPPQLVGATIYDKGDKIKKLGQVRDIENQDISPEFSIYQSDFFYGFYGSTYDDLFKIRVKMIDVKNKTKVDFETAVTPRN
jgi:prepilin-type N-terminal cleavage/methylation domain-containing protein